MSCCCSPLGPLTPEMEEDPPALGIGLFGETRRIAFSASQITASNNQAPRYEWTTAVTVQVYAVGPDNACYYPSVTLDGIAREGLRPSGVMPRYPLTDRNGVASLGFIGAFFAQAPNTGLDPWTFICGRGTGNALYRWSGAVMRGSTMPGFADPDVFTSAAPVPAFGNLVDIAFDTLGNLWTMDTAAVGIVRYPGVNGVPGALVPDVVINGSNWPGSRQSLAIARNGDLWVSNYVAGAGTIRMLDAAGIAAIAGAGLSNPVPNVVITSTELVGAEGLCFDYAGGLWVSSYDNTRLLYFGAPSLTTSGAKTPDIILTGGGRLGNGGATGPLFPRMFQGYGPLR